MTNPNMNDRPKPQPSRRKWRPLILSGMGLGIITISGVVVGAWWIQEKLAPLVESEISKALKRPIQVGRLERFSLTGLRLGRSLIPATAKDPDYASTEAVEVQFFLGDLIFRRTLRLNITLVNPQAYIEQDAKGAWINIETVKPSEGGAIKTEVDTIRVENALAVLVPFPRLGQKVSAPISVKLRDANAKIRDRNQQVLYELNGEFLTAGKFRVKADSLLPTGETNVLLEGQSLPVAELTRLFKLPEISFLAGQGNGNLTVQLRQNQLSSITGVASFTGVEAKINSLKQEIRNTSGQVRFRGSSIAVDNLRVSYGEIPLAIVGTIEGGANFDLSLTKFNLIAKSVQPVTVAMLLNAVNKELEKPVKLPVPVVGEVEVVAKLTGNFLQPLLLGTIATTKLFQVDRLQFSNISTRFAVAKGREMGDNARSRDVSPVNKFTSLAVSLSDIRVVPIVGGEITGKGQIGIGLGSGSLRSGLVLDLDAQNLPAEAIARLYQVSFPAAIAIGNVSGKATIFGPLDNIQGQVKWQAPQATYPVTGELRIARSAAQLQNVKLNIAGGTVNVSGGLNNRRWEALVVSDRVDLSRLREEVSALNLPSGLEGILSGRVLASGALGNFNLNAITTRFIGSLTTSVGTINGRGVLESGRWQAIADAEEIAIASVVDLGLPILTAINPNPNQLKERLQNLQSLDGRISGQVRAIGSLDSLNSQDLKGIAADGKGRITVAGGTVNATGKVENGQWQGLISAEAIALNPIINAGLPFFDGKTQTQLQNLQSLNSKISGQIRALGSLDKLNLNAIAIQAQGLTINVGDGTLKAGGKLEGGEWQGLIIADAIALNPIINAGLPFVEGDPKSQLENLQSLDGKVSGQIRIAGPSENITLKAITAFANGQIVTNQLGTIIAQTSLDKNRWQAFIETKSLPINNLEETLRKIGLLNQSLPSEINGLLDGRMRLSGDLNNLTKEAILALAEGELQLDNSGGIVRGKGELTAGNWRATIGGDRIALSRFQKALESQRSRLQASGLISQAQNLPILGGLFRGQINLSGPLTFNPQAVKAGGILQLSELPILKQPFAALFNWNGKRLEVEKAATPGFETSGFFEMDFSGKGLPSLANLDFNVKLSNFDLNALAINAPAALKNVSGPQILAGKADFVGRISGSLADIKLVGDLQLRDFVVNQVAFESVLFGTINAELGKGLDLRLAGQKDQIQLALNQTYLPTAFLIRRGDAIANGNVENDVLKINLVQFPLDTLNLTPAKDVGLGQVTGLASGKINIPGWKLPLNLAALQAGGQISINQPAIGHIKGDNFQGEFKYANGVATLNNAQLQVRQSQYLISGMVKAGNNPEFSGKVKVEKGNLQDVLLTLQYFNLSDLARGLKAPIYGTAADLQTVAVGMPDARLIEQLRRLAEIQVILDNQRQAQTASKIPPLADLQGNFGGEISFLGSLQTGIQAKFNLLGSDWRWGSYLAEKLSVEGSFQDGILTVLPLEINSGKTAIGFSGQVGPQGQSGQLRVKNMSLEELAKIVELPYLDVTGNLNLRAAIAGSLQNPQATGELSLVDGTLNREPIKNAQGSFSYNNARLNFSGIALITATEPIDLRGSLPFPLPFVKDAVRPDNDKISLNVNLKNEGLAVINLLTPAITWVDGKGNVQIQVGGTLQQPVAEGIATIENATVRSQVFPDPLTGLTGVIRFEGDRIRVESAKGMLSKGEVTAVGVIPLARSFDSDDRDRANQLTVTLDKLAVNLKGLYRGAANGQVIVGGTAIRPQLGGRIDLSNGQVFLATTGSVAATTEVQNNQQTDSESEESPSNSSGFNASQNNPFEIGFNNLRLNLGKKVEVTSPPILSFLATGGLTVNGTLDDIRPQGVIKLTAGAVNLFTTQFRLDRGYPQTATFVPSQRLDPTLDVRLVTSVPEVTRFVTPTSAVSSEIADNPRGINSGSARSIRIQALAKGRASQLAENIELRSSPSRSETELVALLGGSFVQTLGAGDSTLAIANLAGAGLFSNIQSAVTNATGLTEFRLFPTRIRKQEEAASSSSTLGLGLEVGQDITQNLSASVIRVLAPNQPTEFTLRYRLNDNVLLRGSTDLQGDNRATIEYEVKF
ncbi:hypothetical protein BCD67_06110 [Oscillatoriales cyanobacterium USR001]|nr:hypothetical protein BCD67_06110 [Oscillatoriales cyanobacterium USR001]